jgi:hypothetical protein
MKVEFDKISSERFFIVNKIRLLMFKQKLRFHNFSSPMEASENYTLNFWEKHEEMKFNKNYIK